MSGSRSREGELLAVIGPNGAGKTTLFNLVSGPAPADERHASCSTASTSPAEPPFRRARAGIGRTFQVSNVFPLLSVLENVRLAAEAALGGTMRIWRQRDPRARGGRAGALGARAASGSRRAAPLPAGLLSHGDKRKLELAMVLAGDAARDPARRADGRRLDGERAGARRADPLGARERARRC